MQPYAVWRGLPMPHATTNPKQHAHELIDRMAPGQLSAVVGLMEILLDPVARSLANLARGSNVIDAGKCATRG